MFDPYEVLGIVAVDAIVFLVVLFDTTDFFFFILVVGDLAGLGALCCTSFYPGPFGDPSTRGACIGIS